jgi:ABC-type uncharacterized transport system substrate-binding protein
MQFDQLKRREFITLLAGAAAYPLAARAQNASIPIVALLSSGRLPDSLIGIFRQGLTEQGYAEGRNVVIDYRHGDNQYERLAGLAAEFARRQVAVIAALNSPPALAAKAATTTIPIVFMIPDDPVKLGLVVSLSRAGGNATGVSFLLSDLGPKQLGLLRELVPDAKRIGLLVILITPTSRTSRKKSLWPLPQSGSTSKWSRRATVARSRWRLLLWSIIVLTP